MLFKQTLFPLFATIVVCNAPLSGAQQSHLNTCSEGSLFIQQETKKATETIFKIRDATIIMYQSELMDADQINAAVWKILNTQLSRSSHLDHPKSLALESLFRKIKLNIYTKTQRNESLLFVAAQSNLAKVAQLLLSHGATVDEPTGIGATALLEASFSKNCSDILVKLLIAYQADVNYQEPNRGRATPLIVAAMSGQSEKIQMLITAGADQTTKDKEDRDALYWAQHFGHEPFYFQAVAKGEAERKEKIAHYHEALEKEKRAIQQEVSAALPDTAGWQDSAHIISEYVSRPFFEDETHMNQRAILFPKESVATELFAETVAQE